MQRTIVKDVSSWISYNKRNIGVINKKIQKLFKIRYSGKYLIKIVEGKGYMFVSELHNLHDYVYHIYNSNDVHMGYVCAEEFDKLFFRPDLNREYNITVKKL